jgi:aspartate-semialdehyde dehydrogenase
MGKVNLGIVGVSGVVGQKFLEVLEEYGLLFDKIKFFASKKSVGKKIKFQNKLIEVEELKEGCFLDLDYALFSAGSKIASYWGIIAEKEGCTVIDNSSAFRNIDDIPLIVSEINIDDYKLSNRRIIANPNCSTIQSVVVLNEINKVHKIDEIIYSTYQAVSGAGKKGIDDLVNNTSDFFPLNINKTCIPIIGDVEDNNYTNEEIKMIRETKKILHNNNLKVTSTCVRVPIINCHAVAIYIRCLENINLDLVKEKLAICPSIIIVDDSDLNLFPNSLLALNNDYIYVGRIRMDLDNPKGMWIYCVSDNLRKGAASNAVQILKHLIELDQ